MNVTGYFAKALSLDITKRENRAMDVFTNADNTEVNVNINEEDDQFQLLEQKVDYLIERLHSLKEERDSLRDKVANLESQVDSLTHETESLKEKKDVARQKISSILSKMDQIDI